MTINVDAKNFKLTRALRAFARAQVARLFKLSKDLQYVHVYMETVPRKHNELQSNTVTITIGIPGKKIAIQTHGVDMYEAVTTAIKTANRKVRKTYEKRRTRRRTTSLSDVAAAYAVA